MLMAVYFRDDEVLFARALQSIFESHLLPSQVVLVVDGPISKELKDVIDLYDSLECLEVVYLEKNVGLAAALNHGLAYAKFEVVFRADSDDYNYPDRFEKQLKHLESGPFDLIGCAVREVDRSMTPIAV